MKCNCGKEGRYSHFNENGGVVLSCNKYRVCPTYDELLEELNDYKYKFRDLLQASVDVMTFREGTDFYKDAERVIREYEEVAKIGGDNVYQER